MNSPIRAVFLYFLSMSALKYKDAVAIAVVKVSIFGRLSIQSQRPKLSQRTTGHLSLNGAVVPKVVVTRFV